MSRLIQGLLVAALLVFARSDVRAERDPTAPIPQQSGLELVVLEAPGCIYCSLFRRDVLPQYQASPRGHDVPIRFVDLNALDEAPMTFQSPVDIVPTVILLKDRAEVGRITGYVGPENFFHSVDRLFASAGEE
jgi:thioredoxin-related protein